MTRELFGNTTSANIFVVGMAVQAGCLPIEASKIEAAITLNGVSIDVNLAAFGWGRAQVAVPERVEAARKERQPVAIRTKETGHLELATDLAPRIEALGFDAAGKAAVSRFADELVKWGRKSDALAYLDVLERVTAAEEGVEPSSRRLALRVTANLYKLMAFKDEYEVARLMTDLDGFSAASELAAGRDRIAWKLHPPLLRRFGLSRKITLGAWATPAIRLLARAKFLRGTPFDPFGWARIRRLERALPAEYIDALDRALGLLGVENFEAVLALAALPDRVRGYEALKLERVASYREELSRAQAALRGC